MLVRRAIFYPGLPACALPLACVTPAVPRLAELAATDTSLR